MALTYTPIATVQGTGSAGGITFSSIPQTYTDLVLVMNIFTSVPANETVQVNGDTGTNYSTVSYTGNGTSASSTSSNNTTAFLIQSNIYSASTLPAFTVMNFMNYSNTSAYKTVLTRAGRSNQGTEQFVGMWRNTAAITSISLSSAVTYTTDASFTLYGIKVA